MERKEIEKVYVKKINKLKKYDEAYFKYDNPIISDKDYDGIKQEILNLEKKYSYLKSQNSPSKKVGYKPSGKFDKVAHEVPMLSLSNAFSKENVADFFKKIRKYVIQLKLFCGIDREKNGRSYNPRCSCKSREFLCRFKLKTRGRFLRFCLFPFLEFFFFRILG